jgi:iron-sulfur cluster repair protein YtfE (RIC family)
MELLSRFDAPGLEDEPTKNFLFHKIQQELDLQLKVEEVLIYPLVRKLNADQANRVVMKALQDHDEARSLLKEMTELSVENRSLDLKMRALQECVLRHLELETTQIFPYVNTLPAETLQKLSREMEDLREGLRMSQRRAKQPPREREPFYPTLQDANGAPEDDRDTPPTFGSPNESNDRHLSDFENWGSE